MSLKDLIATSGARNFETIRKGWLPTPEEKQARTLRDLQIKDAQSELAYAPTKRRRKEKREDVEVDYRQKLITQVDQKIKQADTQEKWDKLKRNQDITSRNIKGAYNIFQETEDINQAKNAIRQNYDAIIEAGDEGTDKAVDRLLSGDTTDKEAIGTLSNLHALLPTVQDQIDKENLYRVKKRGTSEFDRLAAIPEDDRTTEQDARLKKLAGTQPKYKTVETEGGNVVIYDSANNKVYKPPTPIKTGVQGRHEETLTAKQSKEKRSITTSLRKESDKKLEHFRSIDSSITKALNAMDSGDIGLSDTFLTSILSQVEDTNVKAFAMYQVYDQSFGNAFEVAKDTAYRFAFGVRSPEQQAQIRQVLTKMQQLNKPILDKTKAQYRSLAEKNKLSPDEVVPFETKEELKTYPYWTTEQKLNYWKKNQHIK